MEFLTPEFDSFIRDDGIRIIRLGIFTNHLIQWCIRLSMVRYEIENLVISADNFSLQIELYKGKRRSLNWSGDYFEAANKGCLLVSLDALDGWLRFFLKAVQTGKDPYEHIDMSFYESKKELKAKTMYLVLNILE